LETEPHAVGKPPGSPPRQDKTAPGVVEASRSEATERPERLGETFCERPEALTDETLDDRPIVVAAAEICEALGVEPDWGLWRDENADEAARIDPPGSPYAHAVFARAGRDHLARARPVREHPPP
jgi:hypothetical protein